MSESVLRPGHVAVVTGAGSGIGAALAAAFGDLGGRVVLADVEAGGGEDLDIAHEDAPLHGQVTISIGWASIKPNGRDASVQRLIAQADEALYQAKNRGRNRLWPEVPSLSEGLEP